MNTGTTKNSIQRMPLSIGALMFALSVAFVPSVFMQQGGSYTIKQSVIGDGGGVSSNGGVRAEATIGQGVLGFASGGSFSLNAGFWQAEGGQCAAGIASQPTNQKVCAGLPASFSVTTSGAVSGYQWRKNGVNVTNGGNVSGAQTGTLTINPAGAGDAGSYDCIVSGACGAPVISNSVGLTVNGYVLSSTGQAFASSGGTGSVGVTTDASCGWTAVSNAGWIVITNGSSGTGNGTVIYTVATNVGGGRTGTMTIAGQTFTVTQAAPTIVTLVALEAIAYADGVMIEWRTGLEVDNLGFNLYRDEGGKKTRVNTQMLAGTALKFGQSIAISSGCSYAWWDEKPASESTAYWLEDIDLNGQSAWRGPFSAVQAQGKQRPARVETARTLSAMSSADTPSSRLEPRANLASGMASSAAGQAQSIIASTPGGVKLQVKREGWYRATAEELIEGGLNPKVDPRNLQLFVDGVQQAIRINGEDDGRLDEADSVEFYGVGLDSPFSELRTYYLVAGKQAGLRVPNIQGAAHPSPSGRFPFTVERRDRTIYFSGLRNGDKENFFGAVVAGQPVNQSITVSHLAASNEAASLEISLQGVTNTPHMVRLQLNGSEVGQIAFQGQAEARSTIEISQMLLSDGLNQVTLFAQGGPSDVSLIECIRLTYQHSFTADEDKLSLTISGGQQVTIGGFTSEGIRVFDVTNPLGPQEILGYVHKDETGYGVSLMAPGTGERRLLALTNDNVSQIARIARDYPSTLSNSGQGADLLIITRRELFDSAGPLIALRQKEGLSVGVVDIDDIYDEFSYGQKTPRAVKDFVGVARTMWKKPVRYVLVLGDGSYDPKNYLGLGDFDLVPTRLVDTTFMETASDDWLTDFDGDGIADVAIGRLPVRNAAEASSMIGKIVGYEQSSPAEEALLVGSPGTELEFAL